MVWLLAAKELRWDKNTREKIPKILSGPTISWKEPYGCTDFVDWIICPEEFT